MLVGGVLHVNVKSIELLEARSNNLRRDNRQCNPVREFLPEADVVLPSEDAL
jgi:hypothetical protein